MVFPTPQRCANVRKIVKRRLLDQSINAAQLRIASWIVKRRNGRETKAGKTGYQAEVKLLVRCDVREIDERGFIW
jgi:hypothetical protein